MKCPVCNVSFTVTINGDYIFCPGCRTKIDTVREFRDELAREE